MPDAQAMGWPMAINETRRSRANAIHGEGNRGGRTSDVPGSALLRFRHSVSRCHAGHYPVIVPIPLFAFMNSKLIRQGNKNGRQDGLKHRLRRTAKVRRWEQSGRNGPSTLH